jgi:hypothetical protein
MEIWYCIPTANKQQCSQTFLKWKQMGYMTCALTDGETLKPDNCDYHIHMDEYKGYPWAIKKIVDCLNVPLYVVGGDDIFPDPNTKAHIIGQQYFQKFPDGYGVMQPTGDPYGKNEKGISAAARICGSPWFGRKFALEFNNGTGPFWHEYFHYYCDEEMYEVTKAKNILWQRSDLSQYHNHWHRTKTKTPNYMEKAVTKWDKEQKLFNTRKQQNFPGGLV